jgi:hypothetical protein
MMIELAPPVMHSHVHLVIAFAFPTKSSNRSRLREETRNAEEEYTKLLRLLGSSGLKAVERPGEGTGNHRPGAFPTGEIESIGKIRTVSV